ncbi:hypothetical protein MHI27_11845 [Paenibacillus sp. FSL H8-0261]|uniref:hypothetical protein n=1 Tax=Paenibacillus sp. FSL H8-0261 TaxID=2921381 RepID=UPI003249D5C7
MYPNIHQSKDFLRQDPGLQAYCPECNWEGNCFINISTGTAGRNAQQEADSHNENTIHDSGDDPAITRSCIGGIED